jgi:hypothetical protein
MQPVDFAYDSSDPFGHIRPSGRAHTGSDWLCPTGTVVRAVMPGTIVAIDSNAGNGLCVAQSLPDGRFWSYIHLSEIGCRVGDQVQAGDALALSGNTGTNSQGPHLHCSLSDSPQVYLGLGNLADPWAYLESTPTPPPSTKRNKRMFAMAAIKGEGYVWALWAPGFYYEIKQRPGVTQAEAGAQMNALNDQLIGKANATITRAQANEISAMCLRGPK